MMVVVPEEMDGLGLFRKKKRKTAPVTPPPTKDYGFPLPRPGVTMPSGTVPYPPGQTPEEVPFTLAPTSVVEEYLPWIIGGGVVVLGLGIILYLKGKGKL